MGILGKQTFSDKVEAKVIDNSFQSFSTPFQKTPQGNLSLPYVSDRATLGNYVFFGSDNLFPQTINQVYYSSPLHGAIVDFKTQASVGGGFDVDLTNLDVKEKVDYYTLCKRLGLEKLVPSITRENILHQRVYFLVTLKGGKVTRFERVSSDKVRKNSDGSIFTVAYDWTYQRDLKQYEPYSKKCKEGVYMLAFEEMTVGQDIYPIPQYTSAMNFAFLSGELSYLAKSNIQNSVFPSFAIKFPKKPQGDEEMEAIKQTVNKMKGAENAGKAVAFFANNKEQLPELDAIPTNDNDSLFKEASELITEQICFAHTIDPILLGVRTTGSLGNGSDIKQAYVIFEKNVVMPIRERTEHIINTLFEVAGLDVKLEIKNFQIIEEVITEVEENETVKRLNALPDDIRAKVMDNMSQEQLLKLAGLSVPNEASEGVTPQAPQNTAGTPETQLNDALRGLTGRENQDVLRIIRDFGKEKISKALATARLKAYGFDVETINEILE